MDAAMTQLWVDPATEPVEVITVERRSLVRHVVHRNGTITESHISHRGTPSADLQAAYDLAWLRSRKPPASIAGGQQLRVVDLFAGCGGLSVGVREACRALHLDFVPVLASDLEREILDIYARNLHPADVAHGPIEELLDGELGAPPTVHEEFLMSMVGEVDLVIGGPPCQGHSQLNNRTRGNDPKNDLYLKMGRFCELFSPSHVIIENVPGVEHDLRKAAHKTREFLRSPSLRYMLDDATIDASKVGVAQRRKRNFTIASRLINPSIDQVIQESLTPPRSLRWAIEDLESEAPASVFSSPPSPSDANAARMRFLFEHDEWNLPDSERPDCHRLKPHSYSAVYGRLHWEQPSPTITTGFGSMGRGRYVHSNFPRTITPHEAARIQFFPDFFNFGETTKRTTLQTVIGNAVPPKLGYVIALHLLR
jgi:DNA (cytosine-5)-methyltransferase 1